MQKSYPTHLNRIKNNMADLIEEKILNGEDVKFNSKMFTKGYLAKRKTDFINLKNDIKQILNNEILTSEELISNLLNDFDITERKLHLVIWALLQDGYLEFVDEKVRVKGE